MSTVIVDSTHFLGGKGMPKTLGIFSGKYLKNNKLSGAKYTGIDSKVPQSPFPMFSQEKSGVRRFLETSNPISKIWAL